MFRLVIAEARNLIRQRNEIEALADRLLVDSEDYKRLRQIPGIGPINALAILAEAGDLRRFGHHRQFLKFCGLDLSTQQSGTYRGQTKLSKFGNARLRRTLWLAGQVAIRQKENSFRDKFERYIARDRHNADLRRKALTAITAKMARVVHAVIKSGDDYRPFVEGPVRNPSQQSREGATCDPVDNARVSCLDRYLVLRTVRATVRRWTLCLLWPRTPSSPAGVTWFCIDHHHAASAFSRPETCCPTNRFPSRHRT